MTTGRKSISTVIIVTNNKNPKKPHEITVQANKNYGICDMSPRIGEILSDFQGRQMVFRGTDGKLYLNDTVISELEAALYAMLNPKSENDKTEE